MHILIVKNHVVKMAIVLIINVIANKIIVDKIVPFNAKIIHLKVLALINVWKAILLINPQK